MKHLCHAQGCRVEVPPRMFMCRRSMGTMNQRLRGALLGAYVPGQEQRKDPTPEYIDVAMQCVRAVANKERRTP